MGLFGGDSSTQVRNKTETYNVSQQGTTGTAVSFNNARGNTVNISDREAIARAFTFAQAASENALQFAYDAGRPGVSLSRQQLYIGGAIVAALGLAALIAPRKRGK